MPFGDDDVASGRRVARFRQAQDTCPYWDYPAIFGRVVFVAFFIDIQYPRYVIAILLRYVAGILIFIYATFMWVQEQNGS